VVSKTDPESAGGEPPSKKDVGRDTVVDRGDLMGDGGDGRASQGKGVKDQMGSMDAGGTKAGGKNPNWDLKGR